MSYATPHELLHKYSPLVKWCFWSEGIVSPECKGYEVSSEKDLQITEGMLSITNKKEHSAVKKAIPGQRHKFIDEKGREVGRKDEYLACHSALGTSIKNCGKKFDNATQR